MMLGCHFPLSGIDIKINQMNSRWIPAWLFAFTDYRKTYLYIELNYLKPVLRWKLLKVKISFLEAFIKEAKGFIPFHTLYIQKIKHYQSQLVNVWNKWNFSYSVAFQKLTELLKSKNSPLHIPLGMFENITFSCLALSFLSPPQYNM